MALSLEIVMNTGIFIFSIVAVGIIIGAMGILDGRLWKGWIYLLLTSILFTGISLLKLLDNLYLLNMGVFSNILEFLFVLLFLIFVIYMQRTFEGVRKALRR